MVALLRRLSMSALLLTLCLKTTFVSADPAVMETDIVIYGGPPGGIAAAVAAGEQGRGVLLVEPYSWVGGLMTNGLSHTDFRTFESLTGFFAKHMQRVEEYYREKYGPDSPQLADCFRGTHAEPHVNQLLFEQALAELPTVEVVTRHRLDGVEMEGEGDSRRIAAMTFVDRDGKKTRVTAPMFIDATDEGDLLAAAGVKHRVGREGQDEYNESLAPPKADDHVQGYNFRLMMTERADNRATPQAPDGYRREDFLALLPLLAPDKVRSVFCLNTGGVYKAQKPHPPNGKFDINDVSNGFVRLSLPHLNNAWPEGDHETRRKIFDQHVRHNMGLLYFLQDDDAVPEAYRGEARRWGWCRDEFVENGHLPEQLYVREGRRLVGQYVFTEHDTDDAPNDARSVLQPDSIATGDYGPNCHGTGHEGPAIGGRHTGEFYKTQFIAPYQIPYGVLVPSDVTNLLVPVAASSTHVGFSALRYEPIWCSLGQAAGLAAHLALEQRKSVQQVEVSQLQRRLHAAGSATIYMTDVPPDAPDFALVQWWGQQGGWHGLHGPVDTPRRWGKNLVGQYIRSVPAACR